jgi:tRNA(fMet)-specific endonuclease VapC
MESVAALPWNGWQPSRGISGSFAVESVAAFAWNTQVTALAVAIPTVGELYFGAYNSGRVEANIARVRAFLSPPGPQVLLIDESAAEQFGRFKTLLRRAGRPIGDIDLFIAGVAVRHGLTVVTNNTEHFARIPDLPLENWLETPQQSS